MGRYETAKKLKVSTTLSRTRKRQSIWCSLCSIPRDAEVTVSRKNAGVYEATKPKNERHLSHNDFSEKQCRSKIGCGQAECSLAVAVLDQIKRVPTQEPKYAQGARRSLITPLTKLNWLGGHRTEVIVLDRLLARPEAHQHILRN